MENKVCIHEGEYGVQCKPFKEVDGFATNFNICTRCGSILRLRSSKDNKYSEATSNEILGLFKAIESKIKDQKDPRLALTDISFELIKDKLLEHISKSIELSGYTFIKGAIRKFIKYKDLQIAAEYLIAHNVFKEKANTIDDKRHEDLIHELAQKAKEASEVAKESGVPVITATQKLKEEKDDVKMENEIKIGSREEIAIFDKMGLRMVSNKPTQCNCQYEDNVERLWNSNEPNNKVFINGCKSCNNITAYFDTTANLLYAVKYLISTISLDESYIPNLLDINKFAEMQEASEVAKETGTPVITATQKSKEKKDEEKMENEIKIGSVEEINKFMSEGFKLGTCLKRFPTSNISEDEYELIGHINAAPLGCELTAKRLCYTVPEDIGTHTVNGKQFTIGEVYINGYSNGTVAVWYKDLHSAFSMLSYLNRSFNIKKENLIFKQSFDFLYYGLFQNLLYNEKQELQKEINSIIAPVNKEQETQLNAKEIINRSAKNLADRFMKTVDFSRVGANTGTFTPEETQALLSAKCRLSQEPESNETEEDVSSNQKQASSILSRLGEIKGKAPVGVLPTSTPTKPGEEETDTMTYPGGTLQSFLEKIGGDIESIAKAKDIPVVNPNVKNTVFSLSEYKSKSEDLKECGFSDKEIIKYLYMDLLSYGMSNSLKTQAQKEEIKGKCKVKAAQIFRYFTEDNGMGIFDEEELKKGIDITLS